MNKRSYLILFLFISTLSFSQTPLILSQREQAKVMDALSDDRLRNLLPKLMRKQGIDMWVVMSREYSEDPIIKTRS